jgi:hypothetical protein
MNPTRRSQSSLRVARAVLVGAAGLSLVLGSTPAEALPGLVAFVGSASVLPALSTPVLGGAANGTWDFTIGTGIGATANGDVGTATGGAAGTLGEGKVQDAVDETIPQLGGGAFCGASGGSDGTGSLSVGNTTYTFDASNPIGWLQSAATAIFFTDANGKIPGANVIGLVLALPPTPVSGTGSCLAGTATTFTIVGVAVSLS